MTCKISEMFENGNVKGNISNNEIKSLKWNEHQLFEGVFLKHLITEEETNGQLSCHLVKVNPGCSIDTHIHNEKLEIHEIIDGTGTCTIGESTISYQPGSVALIPADIPHKVVAESEGLFILAKFSPALL